MTQNATPVALVTGARRGIGLGVAKAFLRAGYRVVATARPTDALQALREVEAGLFLAALDVRDQASIARLMAQISQRLGRLDVLVNNAGIGTFADAEGLTRHDVQAMFDTNVVGLFSVTQASLPLLLGSGGGRVINLGSIVDNLHVAGNSAYAASKAAVASMTGTFNEEYKDRNVRFSLVSPGATRTEIWQEREGFDAHDMLSVAEVAEVIVDIARKPLHVRIDALRINPPRGLL